MEHVAIIGNGVAGTTAARFIRKYSDKRITIISSETDHFFSRTALMYIYMGHMKYEHTKPYEDWFWEKNNIDLLRDHVTSIDFDNKQLKLEQTGDMDYDYLILATGSQSNMFGWPGQDLPQVQGLYSYQDLVQMEESTKGIDRAVVIGGGLIGVEMSEMLHSRNIPVTYLIREKGFSSHFLPPQEAEMVSRHVREYHVDLREETELEEILADDKGNVRGIKTKDGEEIPCRFVGLTVGVHPNTDLVKDTKVETDRGILVDEHLQTSVRDVYAIGDCAQVRNPKPGRRALEPIWYSGKIMGISAAKNICDKPTEYDPGLWFNSAKFYDIEYQVYGDIKPQLGDNEETLYWEHPDGKKSIRINYTKDGNVIGFNLMGVRYRQKVCEKWINDKAHIEEVLTNLRAANFDPEFYKRYEQALVDLYNQKTGKSLTLKKKNKVLQLIFG